MRNKRPMTVVGLTRRFEAIRIATSVGIGVAMCFVLIFCISKTPVQASLNLLIGPFKRYNRLAEVLEKMQPMLISGCAVMLMMSVGNFSLINESCAVLAPCFVCTPIILNEAVFGKIPGELGKIVWITASCIGSALIGAVVSLIPPVMKRFFKCDEVITSSLLNTVFGFFSNYYVEYVLYDVEAGLMASKEYPRNAKPTTLIYGSRLTTMFFIGIVVCIVSYFFLYNTRLGYAARIVGKNPSFARASGINVTVVTLLVSSIAGAVAAMGGTLNTLSLNQRFSGRAIDLSDGMFCGIFAKNNPLLLPVAALGLSYLRVTSETMAMNTDIPAELISVMSSFIIMMLAADQLFTSIRDEKIKKTLSVTAEEREERYM